MTTDRNTLKNKLAIDIEMVRNKMVQTGLASGLSDEKTIELSQQLDKLINEYQKLSL